MAITYRPNDDISNEIERLKQKLDIKTATKLLDHLVEQHQKQTDQIAQLKRENYKLSDELYNKKEAIETFVNAFKELSEC